MMVSWKDADWLVADCLKPGDRFWFAITLQAQVNIWVCLVSKDENGALLKSNVVVSVTEAVLMHDDLT